MSPHLLDPDESEEEEKAFNCYELEEIFPFSPLETIEKSANWN
jgi:hypothetical protein